MQGDRLTTQAYVYVTEIENGQNLRQLPLSSVSFMSRWEEFPFPTRKNSTPSSDDGLGSMGGWMA